MKSKLIPIDFFIFMTELMSCLTRSEMQKVLFILIARRCVIWKLNSNNSKISTQRSETIEQVYKEFCRFCNVWPQCGFKDDHMLLPFPLSKPKLPMNSENWKKIVTWFNLSIAPCDLTIKIEGKLKAAARSDKKFVVVFLVKSQGAILIFDYNELQI